ncbi:MAG: alpha-ribazole phosphatase [Acidimicrobiaceae bacterium]|nr:alpha-ribazole phosphatase [Acidimicrobiaceae bacterium]
MLILVRHGQTAVNAAGRLQGRADPPLTDEGRAQASALAPVVTGASRVVCSPLRRARETAELLGLGPIDVDERWVELDYGALDGMAFDEVPADTWRRWRTDPTWAPDGGESLDDVGARVAAACDDLLARPDSDGDIVVVSHVSPIKAAVAWSLGVPQTVSSRMHLALASVCRVALGPAGPVLRTFNETAHLPAGR